MTQLALTHARNLTAKELSNTVRYLDLTKEEMVELMEVWADNLARVSFDEGYCLGLTEED